MKQTMKDDGFSLIEVMVAMVIVGIALMGTLGAVEVSTRHLQQGVLKSKAIELAQAKMETKRSVRWQYLLEDDLDRDGIPETRMTDDGQGSDRTAGDGVYTASYAHNGVMVVWTIETDRSEPLRSAAMVRIRAVASYSDLNGNTREVQVETIRTNPNFVGQR